MNRVGKSLKVFDFQGILAKFFQITEFRIFWLNGMYVITTNFKISRSQGISRILEDQRLFKFLEQSSLIANSSYDPPILRALSKTSTALLYLP